MVLFSELLSQIRLYSKYFAPSSKIKKQFIIY